MKKLVFSDHAEIRRRERGFIDIEIMYVIERPFKKRTRPDGIIEVIGKIKNKKIKIAYIEEESYLKIITIINLK